MDFGKYLNGLLDLFFPPCCVGCGNVLVIAESDVCTHCLYQLAFTHYHRRKEHDAEKLFWGLVPVEHALSYLYFRELSVAQRLIHHIKFAGAAGLAERFGQDYARVLLEWGHPILDADVLIPVPMQAAKRKQRGYNQSEMFAKGLSMLTDIPVCTSSLIRRNSSKTQVGRGRMDRFLNLEHAIIPADSSHLIGKHVVLIDDVLTTGATLVACAEVLLHQAVAKVSVITLFRKRQ